MPRQKQPISPELTGPVAQFAWSLRELRDRAGNPPYDAMAKQGFSSKTSLATADTGRKLPSWEVTRAYVLACGGDEQAWRDRWRSTREQDRGSKNAADAMSPAALTTTPCTGLPPYPGLARTSAQYRDLLKELRTWAGGPSYQKLSKRAAELGHRLPRSTLGDLLNGTTKSPPKPDTVHAYLLACGLPENDLDCWTSAYDRIYRPSSQKDRVHAAQVQRRKPGSAEASAAVPSPRITSRPQARAEPVRQCHHRSPSSAPREARYARAQPRGVRRPQRPHAVRAGTDRTLRGVVLDSRRPPDGRDVRGGATTGDRGNDQPSVTGPGGHRPSRRQVEERDDAWADLPCESDPRGSWRGFWLAVAIFAIIGILGLPIQHAVTIEPAGEPRGHQATPASFDADGTDAVRPPGFESLILHRELHRGIWNGALVGR